MKIDEYTAANKLAWNYAIPQHQRTNHKIIENKLNEGSLFIDQKQINLMQKHIDFKDKRIIHLCCNNGLELISLAKMGASKLVGIDISEEAIKEANRWNSKLSLQIFFECMDVYKIPTTYFNNFDVVYLSVGTLRWMPDLNKFFEIINTLLVPGGQVCINEMHPLTEIINDDRDVSRSPLEIISSFNNKGPYTDCGSLDYVGHTNEPGKQRYWFVYSLSDILGTALNNSWRLLLFEESLEDKARVYQLLTKQDIKVPLSMTLIFLKDTDKV